LTNKCKRAAIISTHPIQYNAPLFKLLAQQKDLVIKVFYTWGETVLKSKFDHGFGKIIEWDIPLFDGYDYAFPRNISRNPGSHHFWGINNPDLINDIKTWKPDSLLIFGWNYRTHLRVMRYFKGRIPIYFRGDSTLLDEKPGIKQILRRTILRNIYKNIDYAFYVGTRNKEYYITHGLKEEQLLFAPHAIDNDRFMENSEHKKQNALEWRRSLGISDDHMVFLFAGKYESKKNPEILISVLKTMNDREFYLIFVGNGVLEDKLKENSRGYDNIYFLDFQNQKTMPIVYRMADVFVYPSIGPGETWGLAVNEAMACGVPIIVSDKVGCAVDLVIEGSTGFTFSSGNVDDLRSKMLYFINQRDQISTIGAKGSQYIQKYSFNAIMKAMTREMTK
jgi:glycosyltransferase involved in cell wall biosynthesis